MKSTELRIGNLVIVNHITDLIGTVSWIQNDSISIDVPRQEDLTNGVIAHPNRVFPIPLNEQWLEKFGMIEFKEKGYNRFNFSDNEWFSVGLEGSWCSLYCNNIYYAVDFKFVHQLQNLYFALTGQELTVKETHTCQPQQVTETNTVTVPLNWKT